MLYAYENIFSLLIDMGHKEYINTKRRNAYIESLITFFEKLNYKNNKYLIIYYFFVKEVVVFFFIVSNLVRCSISKISSLTLFGIEYPHPIYIYLIDFLINL